MSVQPLFQESSFGINILGKFHETPLKMKKAGKKLVPWWVHKDRDPKMRRAASRMAKQTCQSGVKQAAAGEQQSLAFHCLV